MQADRPSPAAGRRAAQAAPPRKPGRDDAYGIHTVAALAVNRFLLRHLVRTYHGFDGDLTACIVLGQIAHHNMGALLGEARNLGDLVERLATRGNPKPEELLPANAHSIARATGIPRETVRRKILWLVAKGWLKQDGRANLMVTAAPARFFREASETSIRELLEVARLVAPLHERRRGTPAAGPAPRRRH